MRKLCIVHFVELEKFPPAINLIRYLASRRESNFSIDVLTTTSNENRVPAIEGVTIHSLVKWKQQMSKIGRAWQYAWFNLRAFVSLIRIRPDVILYYESLSSGPPLLYKKFVNRSVEIYVHYHEYTSPQEYESGMLLNRWLHKMEMNWYKKTNWLSHTNQDRMNLFLKDVNSHSPSFTYTLPNYPPRQWSRIAAKERSQKTRFVYVGAISLDTMYVKEMVDFICSHASECSLDIYSSNLSGEVTSYLEASGCDAIHFMGEVAYDQLPGVLSNYDVGLVIYKGHIPNYIYNVPNKLFEYHVCGLDVWFPSSMISSLKFQTGNTFPKIFAVDFSQLKSLDLKKVLDRSGLSEKQYEFNCEIAYRPLAEKLEGQHGR
jgi:hypothetical protein